LLLVLDFPDPRLDDVRFESRLLEDRLEGFELEDLEPEEDLDLDCWEDRDGGGSTVCRQAYTYSPLTYWALLCQVLRFTRLT